MQRNFHQNYLILLLIINTLGFHSAFSQGNKIPKNVKKYEKPAKALAEANKPISLPEPINGMTYGSPIKQFDQLVDQWIEKTYQKTIDESIPKKDTAVYTRMAHLSAFQSSVDIDESFDFDLAQYVSFTDWNKKYHFITMYFDTKGGNAGIEYLDSVMTRHYFVSDVKRNIVIYKSVDRSGNIIVKVIPNPVNLTGNSAMAEAWPLTETKQQKKSKEKTKEKPKYLNREFNDINIGTSFNHAIVKYSTLQQKAPKSMVQTISCLLPQHIVYMSQIIKDSKYMLLDVSATYGDKPFYTSKWKTVKISQKNHSVSMAESSNK